MSNKAGGSKRKKQSVTINEPKPEAKKGGDAGSNETPKPAADAS